MRIKLPSRRVLIPASLFALIGPQTYAGKILKEFRFKYNQRVAGENFEYIFHYFFFNFCYF